MTESRKSSLRRAHAIALLVVTMSGTIFSLPAVATTSVPFKDVNAQGYIGFCDTHKQQITSGSIYDQPYVWTAVSSTPAPSGYEHGKAVLLAYQPRKDVDPGEWSGRQLTAASSFTNPKHPMTQATHADDPLLFFVQAFPPHWDGLVQLRIHYGAPNTPVLQRPYPATIIRVTGSRWAVVDGGKVDCSAGKATSDETLTLPRSSLASTPPLAVDGVVKNPGASASPEPGSTSSTENVASGTSNRGGGSGFSFVAIGLIAVAALGGVFGISTWRRRRIPTKT